MSFINSPSSTAKSDVFTGSGTWTKPAGVTFVQVQAWGAAGGGGSGTSAATTTSAGGGGGGGACTQYTFPASGVPSSVTVTIGAGGAGGAATATTTSLVGANGGNTTFGSLLTAKGGSGGTIAGSNAGGAGGGNGLTSTSQGYGGGGGSQNTASRGNIAEFGGGSGGAGNVFNNQLFGGAGANSQWGGAGGSGGSPVSSGQGRWALPAGLSTDLLTTDLSGANCGVNGSNGDAGAVQRTIVPVGGGGGGGSSSAASYSRSGSLRFFNSTLVTPATLGFYYSTDDGTTWAYQGTNGFCIDFVYLSGFWYMLLNRDSICYIGKGTTLFNMTFTQVGGVVTDGQGLATDGTRLAVLGTYSNRYYSVWVSTDAAVTFTETIFSTNNNDSMGHLSYASGFFFISANPFGTSIYSPDCSSGSFVGTNNGTTQKYSFGMDRIGGIYVAAYTGSIANGIWTDPTAPAQGTNSLNGVNLVDVVANTTIAVTVGNTGAIYTSTNGTAWTVRTSGTTDNLNNVVWTGTKFVAMTAQNQFRTLNSTNGITWTAGTNLTSAAFFNAGAGGAGGIASGGGGGGGGYTGYNSGAGGLGGSGYVRVYSW